MTNQDTTNEMNETVRSTETGVGYQFALRTAAAAGLFSLIVFALLLFDNSRRTAQDPFESTAWKVLQRARMEEPDNKELNEEARELDLQMRIEFFRQRDFSAIGAWLLLGGVAVFLISAKSAATMRRKLPMPTAEASPRDIEAQWTRIGRYGVACVALLLVGTAVTLIVRFPSGLPKNVKELAALFAPDPEEPTEEPTEEFSPEEMWPRFRGPGGLGISAYTNVPDTWNGLTGEGIVWKVPVPLPGNSSPVVWGNRLFLTGATEEQRQVYCFDTATGEILWQQDVAGPPVDPEEPMEIMDATGYAAPTMATDGRWVFAMFATGNLAAFDLDGEPAWTRSLGIPENSYGHASSLALFEDLLLVQIDQSTKKAGKSKLLALDVATGDTVWETARAMGNSWPTPIVIHHADRDQIITGGDPWVIAYDPADGSEIWRAECLRQDVGPSPVFANGVVFVANEFPYVSAIRADGTGNVTETHILWQGEDGLPDTACPVATSEFVYLLASYGMLTCYDAKSGEWLWEQDFDDTFTSSPSLVGDRLYLFGLEGKCWVVKPNRETCEIIAQSNLGGEEKDDMEECVTSPALQDGRLYIRGKKHLFCIGQP